MTLTELLQDLGVPFTPPNERGWITIECPWCGVPGKAGLGIHPETHSCTCWKCGRHSLQEALVLASSKSMSEIKGLLGGTEKLYVVPDRKIHGKLTLPPGLSDSLLPFQKRYLESRGFDCDLLRRLWDIRGIGLEGLTRGLAWRIFIPVYFNGEMVSWTTRAASDSEDVKPRYINAKKDEEKIPIKETLGGVDYCRHVVIVNEGPLDSVKIGPGAACTWGVGYTSAQLSQIAKFPVRVIVFDSERAAQERAREMCHSLEAFDGKTVRIELDAHDPGSAKPKEIARLRKEWLE